jgi:hypothetical protein
MATATVGVAQGSVDEQALRAQYGDSINYSYGTNQFVGADRQATNEAYQRYLSSMGVSPTGTVDLNSLTGYTTVNGANPNSSYNEQANANYNVNTGGGNTYVPYDDSAAMANIQNQLQSSASSYLTQQQAGLEQILSTTIANLSKAYEQAIADGQISVREAQDAFLKQKAQIEKTAYQQAEATRVYGNNSGLSSSQQMAGLMASDNSRTNASVNTATSDRDLRIANVRDQINAITLQQNLDLANASNQYYSGMLGAGAEASKMVSDGTLQLQMDSLNNNREMSNQLQLADVANNYQLGQMAANNQYSLEQMGTENKYNLEQMGVANQYNKENAAQSQLYALEQMDVANKYDIAMQELQYNQQLSFEDIQYAHSLALQYASTSAQKTAATDALDKEFISRCKAYNIDPDSPTANYQLRIAEANFANQKAIMEANYPDYAAQITELEAGLNSLGARPTTPSTSGSSGGGLLSMKLPSSLSTQQAAYDEQKAYYQEAIKRLQDAMILK